MKFNKEPKVGIGIPFTTWNPLVQESVKHCLNLNYKNFIIILVPDEKNAIPKQYLKNRRILIRPVKSPIIAAKRNHALKATQCNFYACLDSDAYPDPNWLKNAVIAFGLDQLIWAVGGPNISPSSLDLKKIAVANALQSTFVTGPRVFTKKYSKSRYTDDLPACNLIIKKELIDSIGYFNEFFMTAEDSDLCARILKAGKKIYFAKNVVVYHHNRSLFLPFIKQKIIFGYAVIPLLKQNLGTKRFFLLPLFFVIYLFLGWMGMFLNQDLLWIWLIIILAYLLVATVEALHWSKAAREVPLTFMALLIGNITPGIGSLLALLNVKINFKKFYTNFNPKSAADTEV